MTWKRPDIRQRMQIFLKSLEKKSYSYLLDTGSDTGVFADILADFHHTSIIQMDKSRIAITADDGYIGRVEQLPHRKKSLDVIVLGQVLHYIPYEDHQNLLQNLLRFLTVDGTLIIVEYLSQRSYGWLPYPVNPEYFIDKKDYILSDIIYDNDKTRPKYTVYLKTSKS